jgi:hypothetical protein
VSQRKTINTYIDGAWNVICDICGSKRKNFQCVMTQIPESPNLFVCKDTCVDKHNAQYDVRGVTDQQVVPIVRNDSNSNTSGFVAVSPYTGPITAAQLQTNGVV